MNKIFQIVKGFNKAEGRSASQRLFMMITYTDNIIFRNYRYVGLGSKKHNDTKIWVEVGKENIILSRFEIFKTLSKDTDIRLNYPSVDKDDKFI